MKIEFTANNKPSAKAHVANLHKELCRVIAGGLVDSLTIDGVQMIGQQVVDETGTTDLHPTDEKQDKHTGHPQGHAHKADSYSYTLVPKP